MQKKISPWAALAAGVQYLLIAVIVLISIQTSFAGSLPTDASLGGTPLATPLTAASFDPPSCAEWVDGAEKPCANATQVRQLVSTQTMPSGLQAVAFGTSRQPGPRHLRIGFTAPVAVGSVLIRGGGQLSVLRAGAAYPGSLVDDSLWVPAQRIVNRRVAAADVDRDSYALWVLPAGTQTRALRLTHVAVGTDTNYAGFVGGIEVFSARLANLAPQALVTTSANLHDSPRLVDEKENAWLAWDNGPNFPHPVTAQTPEWVMLSWAKPVTLRGIAALWAGFNAGSVQVFTGAEGQMPQEAPESAWQTVGGAFTLRSQYPRPLGVDWLDFGKTVTTRAVRLRITQVTDESHHPHLVGHTKNGNRIWLGELMAVSPLGSSDLQSEILPAAADAGPHPPIPVKFHMPEAGYVSLVIDDPQGNRVRNLVSDTWYEAGDNTAWWDGTDDLGRNPDAAVHGVYLIPTHYVPAGKYTVRGIYHQAIDARYEFSVYNGGHPAWETSDGKGGWLTNHTPPSAALFVPAEKAPGGKPLIYLGSYISEGGSGLAWVDLDGHKQGGVGWVGGTWTGAEYLARDAGSQADPDVFAYVASPWGEDAPKNPKHPQAAIRVTALTLHGEKPVTPYTFDPGATQEYYVDGRPIFTHQMGGLAVRDRLAVTSLTLLNKLVFREASTGRALGAVPLDSPRGVAFDAQGCLLVLSGTQLLRYAALGPATQFRVDGLAKPEIVLSGKLEDPAGIVLDAQGNIYISDRGKSHQVKVFNASGAFVRAIGHAGVPQAGPYDRLHMNNPRGMAIDSNNHLWVAEEDFQPKRVSVWSLDGNLLSTFYGPAEYGGGGTLDPQDKTRFYYHGMEFKLDWAAGTDTLTSVLYRDGEGKIPLPALGSPGTALYRNGHRYFTNTFTGHATNGTSTAVVYLDRGGLLQPVAAVGRVLEWPLLAGAAFQSRWPQGMDLSKNVPRDLLFAWSDKNENGAVDPDEVEMQATTTNWMTVMPDLSIEDEFVAGNVVQYAPVRFTANGVPVYELVKGQALLDGAQWPASDGGGQVLRLPQETVISTAPKPFAPQGVGGVDAQGHRWSYPSLWPGLHPSHGAPLPDKPGILTGTTHLLGGFVTPQGAQTAPLWAINSNFGEVYLFTADGFFVTQLFQDERSGKPWTMPAAPRNMLLNDLSLNGENFYPSISQTSDGKVYLVDGRRTSLVRLDGLNSLRSLPASTVDVTTAELLQAQAGMKLVEVARQQQAGAKALTVTMRSGAAPSLEGLIASLSSAAWAPIDRRITRVGWNDHPDLTEAALTVAGGQLYVAFRGNDPKLLVNSGAVSNALFKTGGALDLMIGANPNADPKRISAVAGDERLLVAFVNGKPKALLYRAVAPGTGVRVPFSSPARTITFDQVLDVSSQISFHADGGNYAFSIPLTTLGLRPAAGQKIKADIGILRGTGTSTTQRVYWSNKATGIAEDVPSEAELTPDLWGEWIFQPQP